VEYGVAARYIEPGMVKKNKQVLGEWECERGHEQHGKAKAARRMQVETTARG